MASPKKPKPRDVSRQSPSEEETATLTATFFAGTTSPMVMARLGQAPIEHELEQQHRKKFKKRDDGTWNKLTDDGAPLGTFSAKLIAGYAFRLYDEISLRNFNLIREIRNAFAHSKRLITFDEPAIAHSIRCVSMPKKRSSRLYKHLLLVTKDAKKDPKSGFQGLCVSMYIELLRAGSRSYKASTRNYERSFQKSLRGNPLFSHNPVGLGLAGFQRPSGLGHIFDPTIPIPELTALASSQTQKKS